jgi:hypothetical protein
MPVRGRILCAGLYFFFLLQIPHANPLSTPAPSAAGCQVDADVDQGVSDDAQPHPALSGQGVNPGSLPIFLLADVVMASPVTDLGTCCILGYHGTSGLPIQTYAPMDFDTTGVFGLGIFDTSVSGHEVGEWMNDPYGDNPVPPWGHIGQQPGCQNNLEVGDPLTGINFHTLVMPNGYGYHVGELVFFSWFFCAPSIAVNGWYSDNNTFTSDAGPPCM